MLGGDKNTAAVAKLVAKRSDGAAGSIFVVSCWGIFLVINGD